MQETKRRKNFFDVFSKYKPSVIEKNILDSVKKFNIYSNKEERIVEAVIWFDEIVDKEILHIIEKKICETYNLSNMLIKPKYPKIKFTEAYFEQVLIEAKRYTANTCFLKDCLVEFTDTNKMLVKLAHGGGDYLKRAAAFFELVEKIIRNEFDFAVEINIGGVTALYKGDAADIENQRLQFLALEEEYNRNMEIAEKSGKSANTNNQKNHNTSVSAVNKKTNGNTSSIGMTGMTGIDNSSSQSTTLSKFAEEDIVIHDEEKNILTVGWLDIDLSETTELWGEPEEIFIKETVPVSVANYMTVAGKKKQYRVTAGKVFGIESREMKKSGKIGINIKITNYNASIIVKLVVTKDEADKFLKNIKTGDCLILSGSAAHDTFLDDVVITLESALKAKEVVKIDTAEKKRVELHLHTNMSSMDAAIPPGEIVKYASDIGHTAIAITDHGNVQGFPEAMIAKEKLKSDFKVIYGIEAYLVDDSDSSVYGSIDAKLDEDIFVVFDIETTGLSAASCEIIEIGAVKIKSGEVLEEFNMFVKPEKNIPQIITNLTGITDEMVKDADKIDIVLKKFLEFAGDYMLIAHNATFDIGFIKKFASDCRYPFTNPYLDTLAMSRNINKDLKNHKLDTLVKHYSIENFTHHRACDDSRALAQIFTIMVEQLKSFGVSSVFEMNGMANPNDKQVYHIILLVQNQIGLKNLYKLVSQSFMDYFYKRPRMPKTLLEQHREGIIIGSACEAGELFSAIVDGKPNSKLIEIADFYDYLEVQPIGNNMFYVRNGTAQSIEALQDYNKKVIEIGAKTNKPVAATGDVHFMHKYKAIARKILLKGMKFPDADQDIPLYFRTTEEMLAEFAYLSSEKAYEIVVENTNKIADMIEDIRPIPKGSYTPKMDGAEERLRQACYDKAGEMYKMPLPEIVQKRLDRELEAIIKNGFAVLYVIAMDLVRKSEEEGFLVGSRGSVGSSFVATLTGVTEVNPLPPHYYCKNENCSYSDFITDGSVRSGYDLPDKKCPLCGTDLCHDGQDIPFETFLGFKGEKAPDIDLNFSGRIQAVAHKYTEVLFGKENVFRAGTIGTLADKTAFGFIMKYIEDKSVKINGTHIDWLISNCVGVRRTTGQHPGGVIVVPREYDIYDFTPIQHPADDKTSGVITTHFAFEYLHDTILKLDLLGHDVPTKYRVLKDLTGIDVRDLPMNDPNVLELFASTKSIGVNPKEIDSELGTYGLPEMGTKLVRQMLTETKPKGFADLLQISGLSHGTDVWLGNARELIKKGTCTISEVVGIRDNIMLYLIQLGIDSSIAFKITEDVRKGRGLTAEYEKIMRDYKVPEWYIESCKKIKYMFPKAHASAYIIAAIRIGWFKVYRPLEFYATHFTVQPEGFDAGLALSGKANIWQYIEEIQKKGNEASQKENETVVAMLIVLEMYARGLKFLPVDIYKSAAFEYVIENGKIRLPFSSLNGVGGNAAANIVEYRDKTGKDIFSIEDIRKNARLTKSVVETLKLHKAFGDIPETDQISLF